MTNALSFGDDVTAKVHAIRKVHVQMSAVQEHHFVPFGLSVVRVTCRVFLAKICFDFYDFSNEKMVLVSSHQILSDELPCNLHCRLKIECSWKLTEFSREMGWCHGKILLGKLLLFHIHFASAFIVVKASAMGTFINGKSTPCFADDLRADEIFHVGFIPFVVYVVVPASRAFVHGFAIFGFTDSLVVCYTMEGLG
jgi:hypothetical protein